jgi:mannonate dehydratase
MKRREFVSLASVIAGAGAMGSTLRSAWTESPVTTQDHTPHRKALMKVGTQIGPTSDKMLQFFARHGVKNICGYPPPPGRKGYWELDDLLRLRERVESHGISLDMIPLPLSSSYIAAAENPNIMLGKSPDSDREINNVCEMIRVAARAGIPALKYNLTILGVLRTGRSPGRGGSSYSTWILEKAHQGPPPAETGAVSADQVWERITYFLERVIPVAEECKVRMACHPHDPGVPPHGFRGVVRVLGTVEGLKRFVSIAESEYHGLNFCQGTVSEMLLNPAEQIFDVIRYFGERKKIFNVHFRNIRGRRDSFQEVYPDEGDVDMFRAMEAYKQVGYNHMIMPDHVPFHPDDPGGLQAFAFAFGYIKALIQAVDAAP